MTRDNIQGFIDGYTLAGGQNLQADLVTWMKNHPNYPIDEMGVATITSDLSSYRMALPQTIKATPVPVHITPVVTP